MPHSPCATAIRASTRCPPTAGWAFIGARSHQVVEVEHCLLQKPQADALAAALRQYLAQYHVPGYDETTGRGLVRHLYVREQL